MTRLIFITLSVTDSEVEPDLETKQVHDKYEIKAGLKLPKTKYELETANEYFKVKIDYSEEITDIQFELNHLQKQ